VLIRDAEFCLKDVFPVQYVEDEAYINAEKEKIGKEKEVAAKPPVNEEPANRTRRTRKSNLHANTTTTTTTTTTSTHSHFFNPLSPSIGRYNTFPNDTFTSTTTSNNSGSSSEEGCDEFGTNNKKRRRVSNSTGNISNNTSNNNFNTSNTNYNNESSDSERPKYHLRSTQKRSERQ
jgi:hypothetical protein